MLNHILGPEPQIQDIALISPVLQPWYAVRTKPNQERLVSTSLANKGVEVFLPAYRVRRRWSDRIVETELPLFAGYVFCRLDILKRLPILTTPGVVSILGFGKEPTSIPEQEIEAIRVVLRSGRNVEPCPFLREGEHIRVTRGCLADQEGVLLKKKTEWRMIVSITMLQRSVSVEIDRECIVLL